MKKARHIAVTLFFLTPLYALCQFPSDTVKCLSSRLTIYPAGHPKITQISMKELLAAGKFECVNQTFTIRSFVVESGSPCTGLTRREEKGSWLSNKTIEELKKMDLTGATFIIDNIKVTDKEGTRYCLYPAYFKIVPPK